MQSKVCAWKFMNIKLKMWTGLKVDKKLNDATVTNCIQL